MARGAQAAGLSLSVLAMAGCGDQAPTATAAGPAPAAVGAAPAARAAAGDARPGTAGAGGAAAASFGSGLLAYPDDLQMILLAQRLAGGDPVATIARWAEASPAVRQANEFQRDAALAAERQRLEAVLAAVADSGRLRIRTTTQLGDYDTAAGVWYLSAFQPGSLFTFSHQRDSAALAMQNAREAYRWPMPAAEAEALKRKTQYRTVEVDIDLTITGARMRGNGPQVDARITAFQLGIAGSNGGEIAQVRLADGSP
ncbi:hypothetical protein [Nevskia sp.]|uniref:hypothetical protein n=1 Tax=Nevskia sp. TaxID=1929292 RepID=UPI003F70DC9F